MDNVLNSIPVIYPIISLGKYFWSTYYEPGSVLTTAHKTSECGCFLPNLMIKTNLGIMLNATVCTQFGGFPKPSLPDGKTGVTTTAVQFVHLLHLPPGAIPRPYGVTSQCLAYPLNCSSLKKKKIINKQMALTSSISTTMHHVLNIYRTPQEWSYMC